MSTAVFTCNKYASCKFSLNKFIQLLCVPRADFKSRYSLDKVYPNSNLDITATPEIPKCENFSGFIPLDQLMITYSTSSAPGGQNVNKVNTKVDLRFHVKSANWIPESVRPKILEKYHRLINKDGFLIIRSERTRLQTLNVADCLDKLRFIIRDVEACPEPLKDDDETERLKRHEKACRERLRVKRIRSEIKMGRAAPTIND